MDPSSLPRLNCQQSKWDILDNILGDCYRKRLSLGMPAEMPCVSLDLYEDQLADALVQLNAVEEFAQERADREAASERGDPTQSRASIIMSALIDRRAQTLARRTRALEALSALPTIMEENPPTPLEAWDNYSQRQRIHRPQNLVPLHIHS
jgi:hypothetical protein